MAKEIITWFGDTWEVSNPEEQKTAKTELETAREAVENFMLENANKLHLAYISEEGEAPATMQELIMAVETARTPELRKFFKNYILPFDGGYIKIVVK